jgi:hypothetical protein
MINYQKFLVTMSIQDIGRPRFALIFGNGEHSTPLMNPENDASDLSTRLQNSCSFHVIVALNKTYDEMQEEIRQFHQLVNTPQLLRQGRIVLVYFSGHGGLDHQGKQFLCPNDKRGFIRRLITSEKLISFESDLLERLNPVTQHYSQVTGLKNHELIQRNCNIFIIDACRSTSHSKDGVTPSLPSCPGSYLAFSCQPLGVSFDGAQGRNGNYTTCLLQSLVRGNQVRFNDLFTQTKSLALNYVSQIPHATLPQIIDNTAGEFIFQYHPKFQKQVQKIQNEILSKEPESVWFNMKAFVERNWRQISSFLV